MKSGKVMMILYPSMVGSKTKNEKIGVDYVRQNLSFFDEENDSDPV